MDDRVLLCLLSPDSESTQGSLTAAVEETSCNQLCVDWCLYVCVCVFNFSTLANAKRFCVCGWACVMCTCVSDSQALKLTPANVLNAVGKRTAVFSPLDVEWDFIRG